MIDRLLFNKGTKRMRTPGGRRIAVRSENGVEHPLKEK